MHIKKIVFALIFLFFLFSFKTIYAHDYDNGDVVEKIEMTVEVQESGSAIITEKWYVHSYRKIWICQIK